MWPNVIVFLVADYLDDYVKVYKMFGVEGYEHLAPLYTYNYYIDANIALNSEFKITKICNVESRQILVDIISRHNIREINRLQFNDNIVDILQNNIYLIYLEVGYEYRYSLCGLNLPNLTHLHLHSAYKHPLTSIQCPKLESIITSYHTMSTLQLPFSISHSPTSNTALIYYNNLKYLDLDCSDRVGIHTNASTNINLDYLVCPNLTHLSLCMNSYKIIKFPKMNPFKQLAHLYIDFGFNQSIEDIDLSNIITLKFGGSFNQPVENLLSDAKCPKLTRLKFGNSFDQPIQQLYCSLLEELHFGESFNKPIQQLYCPNLVKINFGKMFNQKIDQLHCPKLKIITLQDTINYQLFLKTANFPNLKHIIFNSIYNIPTIGNYIVNNKYRWEWKF